ncbi:MAG: chemotaxis protein CheW [Gemmatimonadales bacterium]
MSLDDEVQLVTFTIAGHGFAFDVSRVERILRYIDPAPLPEAPGFLEGTIQYGDELLPVVDLRKRFSAPAPVVEETRIIVVDWETGRAGMVADKVLEVLKVAADDIRPPPPIVRGMAARYVSGIARIGEQTTIVLAASKLLDDEEQITLDKLTTGSSHE